MPQNRLVTLLTDFGNRDHYVAAMKGVILRLCPQAQIVDITHEVAPHDILGGAFVLAQAAPHFPPETLHVVVVDPGVGTQRKILAARLGGQIFLFPDNGVITLVADRMPLEAVVTFTNTRLLGKAKVSTTFHGRDIFAPLAAKLRMGLPLERLGPQPDTYKLLDLPTPTSKNCEVVGQIIYVDHFGNLISNISRAMLMEAFDDPLHVVVSLGEQTIGPLEVAYAAAGEGQPLALINSMGYVEVAINVGRACDVLKTGIGATVSVTRK